MINVYIYPYLYLSICMHIHTYIYLCNHLEQPVGIDHRHGAPTTDWSAARVWQRDHPVLDFEALALLVDAGKAEYRGGA